MKKKALRATVSFPGEERKLLEQRMRDAGVRNRSAFIRKMALDGYIVRLDTEDITGMVSLLRRCSSSLDRIAAKADDAGRICGTEISEIRAQVGEVREQARKLVEVFSRIW